MLPRSTARVPGRRPRAAGHPLALAALRRAKVLDSQNWRRSRLLDGQRADRDAVRFDGKRELARTQRSGQNALRFPRGYALMRGAPESFEISPPLLPGEWKKK
jgi:hypothetical protein